MTTEQNISYYENELFTVSLKIKWREIFLKREEYQNDVNYMKAQENDLRRQRIYRIKLMNLYKSILQ